MRKHAVLLYGFLDRQLIMLRRYPINFAGSLLTYLLVFFMIFYGGLAIAPQGFEESLDAIIVGYFLLTTVLSTFFSLSGMINTEARYGTLELLYVSPIRFPVVMGTAVVAGLVTSISIGLVNLTVVLVVTGERLTIDVVTVLPILVLTLAQAIGLSFLLGGVALIYKRIRSMFSILQFVLIVIISLSLTDRFWPKLLPVGQGAAMMNEAMVNGVGLAGFSAFDHALMVTTAAVYLVIGYLSFHLAQHFARQRGLLDDY